MNTQKVVIKRAYYDQGTESVCWVVVLENGREADVVWIREDFGPAFGISANIPDSLITEFCNRMVGKEINLAIGG